MGKTGRVCFCAFSGGLFLLSSGVFPKPELIQPETRKLCQCGPNGFCHFSVCSFSAVVVVDEILVRLRPQCDQH